MLASQRTREIDSYLFSITFEYSNHEAASLLNAADVIQSSHISNHLAPDFHLPTASGQHLRLSDFRGFKVVLAFGATWGRLCQAQLPALARLARESNVVVLAIYSGESLHTIDAFVIEHAVSFPVLNDYNSKVKRQYEVTCLPTIICIDEQCRIAGMHRGEVDEEILNHWLINVSPIEVFQ